MSKILCLSGGIDSMIAYYFLGKPKTIFFDYGDYTSAEKDVVLKIAPDTIIDTSLNLSGEAVTKNAYIPFRNLLFALRASQYDRTVIIAGVKDDVVQDKSPEAFVCMTDIMKSLDPGYYLIDSPFWDKTKSEIVRWFLDNVEDAENLLKLSLSCYTPTEDGKECLTCPSCFRKWNALWDNDIKYQFLNTELMMDYFNKAHDNTYIAERNNSIISCVSKAIVTYASDNIYLRSEKKECNTWCIDIDGVLTIETKGFGDYAYKNRTPNKENIVAVNSLFHKGETIFLHTARYECDREVTTAWLNENGVAYHTLIFDKPQADYYVDDKSFNLVGFRKLK